MQSELVGLMVAAMECDLVTDEADEYYSEMAAHVDLWMPKIRCHVAGMCISDLLEVRHYVPSIEHPLLQHMADEGGARWHSLLGIAAAIPSLHPVFRVLYGHVVRVPLGAVPLSRACSDADNEYLARACAGGEMLWLFGGQRPQVSGVLDPPRPSHTAVACRPG